MKKAIILIIIAITILQLIDWLSNQLVVVNLVTLCGYIVLTAIVFYAAGTHLLLHKLRNTCLDYLKRKLPSY